MSKHTPGPWVWNADRTELRGAKGAVVLQDGEGVWDLCAHAAIVQGNAKRADADARLIALAPEMYDYIAVLAVNGCEEAKWLIAKAEGRDE